VSASSEDTVLHLQGSPLAADSDGDVIAKGRSRSRHLNGGREASYFSSRVLDIGFLFALVLAGFCFAFAALYLYKYLNITSGAIDSIIAKTVDRAPVAQLAISGRLAVAKYSLSSCGIVCGLAFGFLGFALFLLGVRGEMNVKAEDSRRSLQLSRVAPGTFVIVCAAVLIGISVTHSIDFRAQGTYPYEPGPVTSTEGPAGNTYIPPEVVHDRNR
jgi:hypothetical protein